jgi:hypothetical protein
MASCGKSVPDARVTGAASGVSTGAADVQVVKTAALTDDASQERVTTAITLPEGGFLAVTNVRGGSSFVYKISNSGTAIWRKELTDTLANAAGVYANGNYWVAGLLRKTNTPGQNRILDFVQPISADGVVSERLARPDASQSRYFFYCAVEHENKFIQMASIDTLQQFFFMQVPAISMTDSAGIPLWERLTPFDQGRRIEEVPQQIQSCSGIFIASNNRILAAQQILIMPDVKAAEEIHRELSSGVHLRPGTLVLSLDLAGNEVGRIRHNDVIGALLIPTPAGALLLETSYKKPGLADFAGVIDQQVHVYSFDANLKELKPPVVIESSYLDTVGAAYPTPEGGLLLAGCPGTGGDVFLRYITPAGTVSRKRQFSDLGFCGGFYRFSPGQHPGEAMILAQTPNQGNRLLTLRYVN